MVDSFITEVSQDTWILFPWDTEPTIRPALGAARGIGLLTAAAVRSTRRISTSGGRVRISLNACIQFPAC